MRFTNLSRLIMAVAAILICTTAIAQTHPATTVEHNPYTMPGMLVRGHMQIPIQEPFGTMIADMGPVMFQEVAPCTLVSTLAADNYPAPWGGPKFLAWERRTIPVKGFLGTNTWVNPCSHVVPFEAVGVVTRIHAYNDEGAGGVFLSPGTFGAFSGTASLSFLATNGVPETEEAGTMINDNGTVLVEVSRSAVDLGIEILGYFVPDPILGNAGRLAGPQGPQGEMGPAGPQGPKGDEGAKGETGAKGEAGAKGEPGLKGDPGLTGPTGPEGRAGAQGAQGPAGPTGPQGATGPSGPAGTVGIQTIRDVFPTGEGGGTAGVIPCLTTVPQGSAVICTYTEEGSTGNTCSADVVKSGDLWCVYVSGSPNKHFQVIIFSPVTP